MLADDSESEEEAVAMLTPMHAPPEPVLKRTLTSQQRAAKHWRILRFAVHASAAFKQGALNHRRRRFQILWAAGLTIFAGCVSCVPFEILNKMDRGCSDLILFSQYFYAAAEVIWEGGIRQHIFDPKMPLWCHVATLAFDQLRTRLYNMAIDLSLPMPVYLVLKNSGLIVSMFLGVAVQGKRYGAWQVIGVVVITCGVILATFSSRPPKGDSLQDGGSNNTAFVFALTLMCAGVVVTCFMNVVQEFAFGRYGKYYQETVFYANVLGLPLFLFNRSSIVSHATFWSGQWSTLPMIGMAIPHMWLLLLLNIVMQSLMKTSCLKLTALAGSVPNVVTVTVFRFVSLVLSACVMNSPPFPPLSFWLGGIMVLVGTLAYALTSGPAKKGQSKIEKGKTD